MESTQAAIMRMLQDRKDLSIEQALPVINDAIEKFSSYMTTLDSPAQGSLNNPEKALLRTFLVTLIREKI